jgi:hypothetical protein
LGAADMCTNDSNNCEHGPCIPTSATAGYCTEPCTSDNDCPSDQVCRDLEGEPGVKLCKLR